MSKLKKGTAGAPTKDEKRQQKSFSFTAKNWAYFKSLSKKEQKQFSNLVNTFLNDELNNRRVLKHVAQH